MKIQSAGRTRPYADGRNDHGTAHPLLCHPTLPVSSLSRVWRVLFGVFPKEMKIKALEALDNMGILDKAYMRTDQLSGGQMQRVALARTLAQNPKIILADEPVAALDPVTARQVMDDFKKINKEMNISVLINIHHVDLALEYVDRIIGIKAGKIVYDGKASDIDNEVLKEIYGGDLDKVGSSEDLLKRE